MNKKAHCLHKKIWINKGDASVEMKYLYDNPETIIALAYFDFDLYQPTKKCLESNQKTMLPRNDSWIW